MSLYATEEQLNTKAPLPRQLSHFDVPTITRLELHCPCSIRPRTQTAATRHTTWIPGRLPNSPIHNFSPLQQPSSLRSKAPHQERQPSHTIPICPFAPTRKHHRHSTSNLDPLRQIPKPSRTEAAPPRQISRCSLSGWSLGSGTALCYSSPSADCMYRTYPVRVLYTTCRN